MLWVLEEKVIERVGDNRPIHINVRIISATNRNLRQMVDDGIFREDLFYRINVIPINVPPLRERMGDIPLLAESFFRRLQLKSDKKIKGINNDSVELLMEYAWPGNVRELKSAFEYAFVTCQESMIQPYHFPPTVHPAQSPPGKSALDRSEMKKKLLIAALGKADGNQSRAAEILGVSRVTVWNQMSRYGVTARKKING